MPKGYRSTFLACCAAYASQAAVVNLTPILFIPLRAQFGFTYAQLGALVLVNFFTQLLADIGCSPLIDKIGFRFFAVAGHVFAVAGFILFAAVPWLPINPYTGFVAGTVLFSLGGGTLELVISPVVNALPAGEGSGKSALMSLLHSFYCWGQVSVALLTTLFIFVFGKENWPVALLLWALLPLVNALMFLRCPLGSSVPENERSSAFSVMKSPTFIVLFFVILCAGAAELTLSQWTSAFMEEVMAIPKVVGDIAGMCMFAVMMGAGRVLYAVKGNNAALRKLMIAGAALAFVCYLTVSFSTSPLLGLAACAFCGLGVSLLWPGALSLSVEAFPKAGSWMLAIMAAAGDSGASLGPWMAGIIADYSSLRTSLLIAAIFPLGVVLCLLSKKAKTPQYSPPQH